MARETRAVGAEVSAVGPKQWMIFSFGNFTFIMRWYWISIKEGHGED